MTLKPWYFLLLKILLFSSVNGINYEEVEIEDAYETRSRILMVDGNVWLHAGKDRNITFKTTGAGKIYVDETDVSRLPDTAAFNQVTGRVDNINQMMLLMRSRQDTQASALRVVLGSAKHYLLSARNLTLELNALKQWKTDKMARDMRRRGLLVKMTRQIIKINKMIAMNGCDNNKCENGATCIPTFGPNYFCLCPPHYTGKKCEADVDECEVYNGTIAGCQNNGTCINKRGGFECECRSGFHGPLCQYQMSSCSKTFELCGPHGHCVETFNDPGAAPSNVAAYKCICDWGFKMSSDKQNPTCVDVNECESNPCHPGVDCINLPGSFICSGCPEGYKMEGNQCVDVNECEGEIDVCSTRSDCHNTMGSYFCEPCPPGFIGNGDTCVPKDACVDNDCHPMATCKQNDDNYAQAGGYSCFCPDGFVGNGTGDDGCVKSASTACGEHNCVNGATCRPISDSEYHCDCEEGFFGKRCEKVSPCHDNPCSNGGTCVPVNGKAFCECAPHFFGPKCDQEEEFCGEHFSHPDGNYTFTMENTNKSTICDYEFNIPAVNSALKITFTWFDKFGQESEGPTDCATTVANLTLYDGPSDGYPEFGTFCGDVHSVHAPLTNTPITMTGSSAMMRFRGVQGKFSIKWETVKRTCGFRTSKPEGILSVPSNKQDIVCEWYISAPPGKVVQVTIPPILMHSKDSEKCSQNSLEIFDGYSSYDRHRILETCSSTQEQQVVTSTGPFITVSFVSNMLSSVSGLEQIRGFSINYKVVTPDRACGAEIDNVRNEFEFNGYLQSPNYGSLYPPNMDCTWKINGSLSNGSYSGDMVMKLTFDEFDIPSSLSINPRFNYRSFRRLQPAFGTSSLTRLHAYRTLLDIGTCTNDYLKVHDGDGTLVYEGCNPKKPSDNTITVNNAAAVLTFHSDSQENGRGFRLKYEMKCEKQVTGNGTIQTWNFPDGGAAGTCTYIIEAPRTHVIHLRLLTIGLRVLPMSECFYSPKGAEEYPDYVELSGGRTDNIYFNKRYICPRYPFVEGNWLTVSAVRPLKITVGSSGNPAFKGLSMEYKTTNVGCGGIWSSMSGTITSPNYPEKYLPHMHCVYQVYVSWSKVVKLSFDTFDLEVTNSKSCDYDRIEIYTTYHNETVHGDLLGKFCGSMLPPAIYSTTNQMAIVFVSDRSVSGQGFNAKFESISRNTNCDYTFTAPSGTLQMTEQDQNRYEKCTFHIAVHENQRVLIRMQNMTIPCDKSSLSFRNGPSDTSPGFSSLPGDSEICTPKVNYYPVLRSFSNRVTVVFKSTDSRGTTFNMTYETIANGCGGRIDGISGVVAAPQYPLGDKKNLKCDWTVAVALGNKVRFALTALDDLNSADQNGFCPVFASNRLDFYNSPRLRNQHIKRFCAKELASEPITSADNELIIKYAQAGGFQSKPIFGFSGHFTTLCNGIVLNEINGNIQSPGYPHKVYTSQYCSWTIQVPKGNRILATFHHFNIQHQGFYQSSECIGNWLKVDDTDLAEAEISFKTQYNVTNSINKYCDRAVPRSIKSKHNTMKLTYTSNLTPTNSFWLSWTTIGCSRDITQPGRIIVTKEHLDSEIDDFECQYRIQAPIGKKILIKLERFDILPFSGNCTYGKPNFGGLAVFMGTSNASGVAFQTICGPTNSANVSSQTDQMFIQMTLSKNRLATKDGVFLNATVEFIDDASDICGGIIELQRGQKVAIVSPGFPGPYPAGINCRWLVRAPDGYHIEYTVEEFHSPNYHEQRTPTLKKWSSFSNTTCKWMLPYSDGMLSFYKGNSSTGLLAAEKFCEESTTPKTIEFYESESLVVFEGASSMYGQKSGQEARKFNGIRLSVRPRCGGVVTATSSPQVISLFHEGEDVCEMTIKKSPEDSEIFVRIEEYTKINSSAQHTIDDRIDFYSGGVLKYTEMLAATDTTMQELQFQDDVTIKVQHADAPHSAVLVYGTDERSCGGEVRHMEGTIFAPQRRLEKAFDCGWTVSNNLGNSVKVAILAHNLQSTPNCTDSYIELRQFNSSGKLIKRQCDNSAVITDEFEAQSIYIFLRYRPSEDPDDVDVAPLRAPLFKAHYEKVAGGSPPSRFVRNPVLEKEEMVIWTLNTKDESTGILVKFNELYLPSTKSYLRFSEAGENDDVENTGYEEVTGLLTPAEKFFETSLIRVYAKLQKTDKFEFTWMPVPLNYRNLTMEKTKEKKVYDCGGDLVPTFEWSSISSPLPPGQINGYEENVHCRWNLFRPMFTGIEIKFEHLDLEDVESCAYDFVAFRLQFDDLPEESDDPDFASASKHCALSRSNGTFVFSVNRALHIHFVTDRSRHGTGFKLIYRLTCNSFEHIRPGVNFEAIITSPNYNQSLTQREWKCQYSILLESNRKMFVEILDLDIEEQSPCSPTDVLTLGNRFNDGVGTPGRIVPATPGMSQYCGGLGGEAANFTSLKGRLFIRYSSSKSSRKGFKLRVTEVMTECPAGILRINEHTPQRTVYSPEYPQRIPNSAECEYVMAAPNGHRVMLTFDPDQFDIDSSEKCEEMDYLEVRDGPSAHSQLVGRYCGNRPPSSIYSTGSFLYMRLHTSEWGKSRRFVAKFELATCGGTIIVQENSTSHITTPHFPDPFPTPLECEWTVRSPNTHLLEAKVEHLWLFYNQNCTMEQLSVLDGNSTSTPLLGPTCLARNVPETFSRSASNQLTVKFSSNATAARGGRMYCVAKKCGFDVAVKLSETKCGGTITDARGSIKPPGFPGRLLPHVKCIWDFKAKPGSVYRFKLNFTETEGYRRFTLLGAGMRKMCFNDIGIVEGIPPYKVVQHTFLFCKDDKYYDSDTDVSRVIYDDKMSRNLMSREEPSEKDNFYVPFTVDYFMVPAATTKGCTHLVNRNQTFEFGGRRGQKMESFCHLEIRKPPAYGSVYIKFTNYTFTQEMIKDTVMCLAWDAHVAIKSDNPSPIDKMICEATVRNNQTEMVYVNPDIDIWVNQAFREKDDQKFNMTIEFHQCGGIITTPNVGEITSPNFGPGRRYLKDSHCRWILEAPEGQVVKIRIVEMSVAYDHDCGDDVLMIGEGRQAEMNTIHRYCHRMDGEQEMKLEDRFKTLTSKSRYMSMIWATNSKFEDLGWRIQYEFVNEQEECGYHTRGLQGTITTPSFGEKDYQNDLECLWDIQVPLGYHVHLKYRDFDVETSADCVKDQLVVSQEHSTRANSPNGDYYFLFQDEQKENPLCGIEHPPEFDSESNRVRLNFTTDGKTTARGFRVDWTAKCGGIYRLNHGVITSPGYPEGYPNNVSNCMYLIAPEDQNAVIALKFTELDLSSAKTSFGRSPCEEDHLVIVEASSGRQLMSLCGGEPMPKDPLIFKGPIGLSFISDRSYFWTLEDTQLKKNRGFAVAYSMNKCGDSIELREGTKLITMITSPAFPLPYAQELDCLWNITTESDRQLYVRFEKMDLEDFRDCSADYLELFDDSELTASKSMGKFCGGIRKIPQYRVQTTGPNLLVQLKTDFNVNAGGFKIFVTSTLGEKGGCGGKLTATSAWQTLTSPKDEDGEYPPALMCGWHISGPVGTQLRIRIDGIDTERLEYPPGEKPVPECIDSLAIYDGQENFSPALASDVCTKATPPPKMLYTSHRHAFITFETDRDGSGKGFNISYATVENECGGWLEAESETKTLLFKGISKEDNDETGKERTHQRCRFMIQGSKTAPVILDFKSFNIPSKAGDCSDSFVEIRDVGSLQECQHPACAREPYQRKITKICGTNIPNVHISNTNTMQIIVSAEIVPAANKSRPSFKFDYNLLDNCNRTINTSEIKSGRLTSPNFPQPYSENSTCQTILKTNSQKMLIAFSKFELEDPNRLQGYLCEYDYLKLSEAGENGTKYCGMSLPGTVLTSGKDLTALFKSDHSMSMAGYDATYFTVNSERDDRITFSENYDLEGVISNIGYPFGYNASYAQVFTIRPPPSHDCSFLFTDVNIGISGPNEKCTQPSEEYLEIEIFLKGSLKKARIRDCTFTTISTRELILEADTVKRYVKFTFQSDSKKQNDGRGVKIQWICHSIGKTRAVLRAL